MRIGIFGGDHGRLGHDVGQVVASVREVAEQGFAGYWLPQVFDYDALTVLAVAGQAVPGIELGTAVVPTYPRHPMALAGQALTTASASGNRLTLGIGLSHQVVVENMWGLSFDRPLRHMREYLSVLLPLLRGEAADFAGEVITGRGPTAVPGAERVPVLLAALGSKMLALAGSETDGTVTWMTGPRTIADHVAPSVTAAAEAAGRPAPRVVACLPVLVTDDEAAARERAAKAFSIYGTLPSYRAMLDREGAAGPGDVAIVGDEAAVRAGIGRLADAGATDFVAAEFGRDDAEQARTRDLLRSLL